LTHDAHVVPRRSFSHWELRTKTFSNVPHVLLQRAAKNCDRCTFWWQALRGWCLPYPCPRPKTGVFVTSANLSESHSLTKTVADMVYFSDLKKTVPKLNSCAIVLIKRVKVAKVVGSPKLPSHFCR